MSVAGPTPSAPPPARTAFAQRLIPNPAALNPPAPNPPPKPAAPRIYVTARPAGSTGVPLWLVGAVSLVVAGVCFFTWNTHRPDPDYLRAVKLIAEFELAKAPEAINYLDSIYTEALADLDRVDPTSISARPAAALRVNIRQKQKAFAERLRKNQTRIDADRGSTTARDEALFEAQKLENGTDPGAADRVAAIPAPECAEDAAERTRRGARITR